MTPSSPRLHLERHALRQGQRRAVVDRVRRPPHVGLPRIGTGLAPAARLLLAPQDPAPPPPPPPAPSPPPRPPPISAPDGPMLTLAMPQSEPATERNRSA